MSNYLDGLLTRISRSNHFLVEYLGTKLLENINIIDGGSIRVGSNDLE